MTTPEGYQEGYVAGLETVKGMIEMGASLQDIREAVEEAIESEEE